MSTLGLILIFGLLMSLIALVGSVTLLVSAGTLERLLLPLVGLAAGTMLGSAMLHMLPEALAGDPSLGTWLWAVAGFVLFHLLEQTLRFHSHFRDDGGREPVTWLVLIGDGVHNLVGGLAVGSAFVVSPDAGMAVWLAAVAHEIPQELGDFGVLVHGGFSRRGALVANFVSALTFPVGAVVAWWVARDIEIGFLLAFAAGNFLYIGATDLVPELTRLQRPGRIAASFATFCAGLGLMIALRLA